MKVTLASPFGRGVGKADGEGFFMFLFILCGYIFFVVPPHAGGAHPPLAVPKIAYRLGAPSDFDRCAILALLHRPQDALRRRCQIDKGCKALFRMPAVSTILVEGT